jgi:hypothetical protein
MVNNMPKKLTLELAVSKISAVNKSIKILSTEYVSSGEKLHCKCLIDEYEWFATYDNLKQGSGCPKCANHERQTIESVKNKINESNCGLVILDTVYKNATTKMNFLCIRHNKTFKKTWAEFIVSKYHCKDCILEQSITSQRTPVADIKNKLLLLNNGVEIISEDYINLKNEFICVCTIDNCGHIWKSNHKSVLLTTPCPVCSLNKKHTLETAIKRVFNINKNIKILSKEYLNVRSRVKCECLIDGNVWETSWNSLFNGGGCKKCMRKTLSDKFSYDINIIKSMLLSINKNIVILSGVYKNAKSKLLCKCLIDGHEWSARWNDLQSGQGCPECKRNKLTGGWYNTTIAERKKEEMLNKSAVLYVIECYDEFEKFYKIGMTKTSIFKRFRKNSRLPYNYDVKIEINTNLYDATYLEAVLLSLCSDDKYRPIKKFGGHLECFSKIDFDYIDNIINLYNKSEVL